MPSSAFGQVQYLWHLMPCRRSHLCEGWLMQARRLCWRNFCLPDELMAPLSKEMQLRARCWLYRSRLRLGPAAVLSQQVVDCNGVAGFWTTQPSWPASTIPPYGLADPFQSMSARFNCPEKDENTAPSKSCGLLPASQQCLSFVGSKWQPGVHTSPRTEQSHDCQQIPYSTDTACALHG